MLDILQEKLQCSFHLVQDESGSVEYFSSVSRFVSQRNELDERPGGSMKPLWPHRASEEMRCMEDARRWYL